ncbi:MAG: acetyl-CoA hydrolase/transferase C-terminal domain-containing protein [bacterium]
MNPREIYASKKKSLDEFLTLIRPKDRLCASIAAGQPRSLLNQLSNKTDVEEIHLFTGLSAFPYPFFANPNVTVISGYYGPIDRMLNDMGANMSYMPLAFTDFELYVQSFNPRVVMTTLSGMDEEGYLSFGVDSEAAYVPFVKAARDPNCLAIAEVNPRMPVVKGLPELGDNKIHISEVSYVVESEQAVLEIPAAEATEVEKKIAENVTSLIKSGDTLQFGIGSIPNQVAALLAQSKIENLGIHSELVSDGFITLMDSGKVTNTQKGFHDGVSLFTFALGSQKLYDWLDERNGKNKGRAVAAPVSYVNNPHFIAKNKNMASINAGFIIDMSGQVCSEAIGEKQYSGVGGQLNFVEGSIHSPGGRSIMCIKSCVEVNGKRYSNIVESFPLGSIVSTPRHYVQYVVTEYGVANLYGLSDEERPYALIPIAHPEFRDQLMEQAKNRDRVNYKSRLSR